MLRALLWKEWRELRLLRLTGLGLGLVLPLAFLLGAEGFRRGMLPFGGSGSYSLDDLFHRVLPSALALALWPLFSLLTVAQSFCGDRAAGREAFLLERPVGRGRVFLARALTSLGSVLVIVVGTTAAGWAIAWLTTGKAPDADFSLPLLALGVGISIVALLAGLGASALLQSPMAAVLLAVLFGAIPFVLGTQLGGLFPLASFGDTPVGLVLPWLLLPAYALAAWIGLCRGEPAGRGRLARALGAIGASLGVILLAFPILAAASVRSGVRPSWIVPSPRSGAAVALGGGYRARGWIRDLGTGESVRFLPPPVAFALWNEDGSRVAVLTRAGSLGGYRDPRIEIYDAKGESVRAPIPVSDDLQLLKVVWIGRDLVALANRHAGKELSSELLFLRVEDGALTSLDLPGHAWEHALLGPTTNGALLLWSGEAAGTVLRSVDVPGRKLVASPVVLDDTAGRTGSISPSGRYWLRVDRGDGPRVSRVIDLETGSRLAGLELGRRAVWLADDRLAWIEIGAGEKRLLVARPGETPVAIAAWTRACLDLDRSPTGDAVLVRARADTLAICDEAGVPRGLSAVNEERMERRNAPEVLVYEATTGRLVGVPRPLRDLYNSVQWAGAHTLARIDSDDVTFEDVPSR